MIELWEALSLTGGQSELPFEMNGQISGFPLQLCHTSLRSWYVASWIIYGVWSCHPFHIYKEHALLSDILIAKPCELRTQEQVLLKQQYKFGQKKPVHRLPNPMWHEEKSIQSTSTGKSHKSINTHWLIEQGSRYLEHMCQCFVSGHQICILSDSCLWFVFSCDLINPQVDVSLQ